jgi:predicted RNA-binding Zn-ribbon protein involved in translation (DUF1610 family)
MIETLVRRIRQLNLREKCSTEKLPSVRLLKMSAFRFNCPNCGTTMTADETESGMITNCSNCSGELEVPKVSVGVRPDKMPVTSGDLKVKYKILGAVFSPLEQEVEWLLNLIGSKMSIYINFQ